MNIVPAYILGGAARYFPLHLFGDSLFLSDFLQPLFIHDFFR